MTNDAASLAEDSCFKAQLETREHDEACWAAALSLLLSPLVAHISSVVSTPDDRITCASSKLAGRVPAGHCHRRAATAAGALHRRPSANAVSAQPSAARRARCSRQCPCSNNRAGKPIIQVLVGSTRPAAWASSTAKRHHHSISRCNNSSRHLPRDAAGRRLSHVR